jgi:hypothetical protein
MMPVSNGPDSGTDASDGRIVVIGPDGTPASAANAASIVEMNSEAVNSEGPHGQIDDQMSAELISQPAKVLRVGSMIKQLLEEVRSAPLDDASRARLAEIHARSVTELEGGLAPELVAELHRLSLPFTEDSIPSDAELRIAQAQLVGWLEGLFHGIQTAMFAQQVAARAQFEEMRRRAIGAAPPAEGAEPSGEGRHAGPYL